jgi:acyl-CoA synthetase (AMP-forming)/AMP-acid ligase II
LLEKRRGEFLVYDDGYRVRRHTYSDVTRAARGFASKLIAHGVAKGDKIVIWGENRPEWIACYWGIQLAGAIAVPIDYRSSRDFAERIRGIVDARIVLAGDDVDPGVMRATEGTDSTDQIWRMADLDWPADGPVPAITISRDDIAHVFTSGATADPRFIIVRSCQTLTRQEKSMAHKVVVSPIRFRISRR